MFNPCVYKTATTKKTQKNEVTCCPAYTPPHLKTLSKKMVATHLRIIMISKNPRGVALDHSFYCTNTFRTWRKTIPAT